MSSELTQAIKHEANPARAKLLQRYFRTGPGEYGAGDQFIGLTVPQSRIIAKKFAGLSLADLGSNLKSKIHEERLIALLILVAQFQKADAQTQKKIFDLYLRSTKYINNWDLVDLSAHRIVGVYLLDRPKSLLFQLVRSPSLWERRIAILATFQFIAHGQFDASLSLAKILLADKHDLIHKAVGWMLREIGKRDEHVLLKFLNQNYKKMPRTTLRYAIERLNPKQKTFYMKK